MDLPHPLDNPASAPAGESADDLLSKLAGDEIDRLLAESDSEPITSQRPVASATLSQPQQQLAAQPEPQNVPQPLASSVPQSAIANPAAAVDLDEVLQTAEAERNALQQESIDADEPESPAQIDLGEAAEQRQRLPLIFRPLVWLNAPLDPWPDQIRDVMGKIAVITLINACAVLAYVFLVRRHH
jgi:hypothetical protein